LPSPDKRVGLPARIVVTVLVLIAFSPAASFAETLREVLAKSAAPPAARGLANLDREITSYSVLDLVRRRAVPIRPSQRAAGPAGALFTV